MKKFIRSKNILSIILCLIIASAMLPTGVMTASAEAAKTYHVSSDTELDAAVAEINEKDSGTYDIYIDSDFTKNGGFSINKAVTVNIFGENHTLSLTGQQSLQAWNGATLNLGAADYKKTFTVKGNDVIDNDNPGLLYIVGDNSVCNMYSGVTLKDHRGNNYFGGGATVQSGTFNMYGGTIDNCGIDGGSVCYGGGIAVFNGATFTMNDGVIKNCYVKSNYPRNWQYPYVAGGGVFVCRATFTMNGGKIESCSAENDDASGGGVAVITSLDARYDNGSWGCLDSNFTMNGGVIERCTASVCGGALCVGLAYIDIYPLCAVLGILPGSSNLGIFLNNGSLLNSHAKYGGGICLNWIQPYIPIQIKNMDICGNSAYQGGGVCVYNEMSCAEIENCNISDNNSESNGGGVVLINNKSGGETHFTNVSIENNTSDARGAGVYYDADSKLTISGAIVIRGNEYNGKKNNLNILSKDNPVYVDGDLTGSEIGLSDPTLWDDGKEDTDAEAVSTEYLTSGFKSNNTIIPMNAFFSDHAGWYPDYSDTNADEVRLVRMTFDVNYHINNDDMSEIYSDEIFTPYITNHEVKDGKVIKEFHNIPKLKDPDGYVFKGWYYDKDNNNDTRPIKFGETYEGDDNVYVKGIDIYAHWEPAEEVEKDPEDDKILPADMHNKYSSFGLFGVQIRPKDWRDKNIDKLKSQPGGLRFITSISENLLAELEKLQPDNKKLNDNTTNYEYGYVAAPRKYVDIYAAHYGRNTTNYELRYSGEDVNGENTTGSIKDVDHDYDYVTNVDCTSKPGRVDHKSFSQYRLSTFVVTYEKGDAAYKDREVCARAYLRYYDANGLLRTFYNDYGGTTTYGGCSVSYNEASGHINTENTDTYYKEGAN